MCEFYVEKENETTSTIFNKRVIYDFESINSDYMEECQINLIQYILIMFILS